MMDYLIKLLGNDDAHAFSIWALGENYQNQFLRDIPRLWNYLHSDLFTITRFGDPKADVKRMIKAWRKNEVE